MMPATLDQAVGLRRMMRPPGVRVLPVFGTADRLPAIVNLASALARAGQQVLVMDASRGEIAPAFGLTARYELKHVLEGEIAFEQAVLATRDGVQVLPAARGIRMLTDARVNGHDFFDSLAQKAAPADLIIVNCESADRAARLLPAHGEALLVLSRGPKAIAEGAVYLKSLSTLQAMARFRVLMMRTALDEAQRLVDTLAQLAGDRLGVDVAFGGNAPPDRRVWEAARVWRTVFEIDPTGPVTRAFQIAATSVMDWDLARVAGKPAAAGLPVRAMRATGATTNLH